MTLSVAADVMFRQDTTSEFQHMVDRVYKETSRHLLDVLNTKYKFLEHLKVRGTSIAERKQLSVLYMHVTVNQHRVACKKPSQDSL